MSFRPPINVWNFRNNSCLIDALNTNSSKNFDNEQINCKQRASLKHTDLKEIFKLIGDAFFRDWIVVDNQPSALFAASSSLIASMISSKQFVNILSMIK